MKELLVAILIAVFAPALMVAGHWVVGQLWLPAFLGSMVPTLAFFVGLFGLPYAVAWVAICAYHRRWRTARLAVAAVVGASIALIFLGDAIRYGMKLRIQGFNVLAREARPLVAAIKRYQAEAGRPPASLGVLVPTYIPKLPSWVGRVDYIQEGDRRSRELYGNSWILWVNAAWGMGFDSFVYFPNEEYPHYFYGGTPERVREWAYVNE